MPIIYWNVEIESIQLHMTRQKQMIGTAVSEPTQATASYAALFEWYLE